MKGMENDLAAKLKEDPISFAMMLDDEEIEEVIAAFVSVLNRRKRSRGGWN